MENFTDRTDAIIDLQARGYDQDFILANENIFCVQRGDIIPPDNFEITETYCFESGSKQSDNYVIYAIRAIHEDLKGILMTTYSSLSRGVSIHLWSKLAQSHSA